VKALDSLLSPRSRRIYVLSIYAVLLVAVLSTTLVFVLVLLSRSHTAFTDKLGGVADVLAGGTLLLAVIAGLVALQAYAAATGLPDLELQVRFEYSQENHPVFRGSVAAGGWVEATSPLGQTAATILIRNRSDYSARDPALVVRLVAMTFDHRGEDSDWLIIESDNMGVSAVQWDGGPMYSIHGGSIRRLPLLDLRSLRYRPERGEPALMFELLSDGGYRRKVYMAAGFVEDADSMESLAPRNAIRNEGVGWM
jgi:hypothetical protein